MVYVQRQPDLELLLFVHSQVFQDILVCQTIAVFYILGQPPPSVPSVAENPAPPL